MATEGAAEELARIAASLRAYLEWQEDTGATGIPRRAKALATTTPEEPARVAKEEPLGPPASLPPLEVPAAPTTASSTPSAPPKAALAPAVPARPLEVVREEVASCTKCGLAATRTQTVFARGNPRARLCIVGEAPGADEDAQGLPFVGRAGQLLDKMIAAMGLDPEKDVYVCNIVKCRPPENRTPESGEIEACIPYLHEQLANVKPEAIVAMGNTAVGALLGTKLGITKVRGQWKLYRGDVPVMPTFHPSYLLRPGAQQAEAKKQAWEDLQAVMKHLGIAKKPPRG